MIPSNVLHGTPALAPCDREAVSGETRAGPSGQQMQRSGKHSGIGVVIFTKVRLNLHNPIYQCSYCPVCRLRVHSVEKLPSLD